MKKIYAGVAGLILSVLGAICSTTDASAQGVGQAFCRNESAYLRANSTSCGGGEIRNPTYGYRIYQSHRYGYATQHRYGKRRPAPVVTNPCGGSPCAAPVQTVARPTILVQPNVVVVPGNVQYVGRSAPCGTCNGGCNTCGGNQQTAAVNPGVPGGGYVAGAPRSPQECVARGGSDTGRGCQNYK